MPSLLPATATYPGSGTTRCASTCTERVPNGTVTCGPLPWPSWPWRAAPRAMLFGTSAYFANSIVNSALPCVERAERRREAEHLGERHLGVDARVAVFFGRAHDDAAALHDEAEHVARELRRTFDRDLHDRLEDLRVRAREEVAECAASRFLERDIARVDRVRLTVVDRRRGDRRPARRGAATSGSST